MLLDAKGNPLRPSAPAKAAPAATPAPQAALGTAPNPAPRRTTLADATPLYLLAESNPKKPGTKAHANFTRYAGCSTVGEYVAAMAEAGEGRGQAMRCIMWDAPRGYIRLG